MRMLGWAAAGLVGLLALGGLGGGLGGGGGGGIGANTPGGLGQERLALDIGGGYAIAKGGAKCLEKGRACFSRGSGGGGGGGTADGSSRGSKEKEGESATKGTTPPTAPPQQPPAPAPPQPQPVPVMPPPPNEPERQPDAAVTPLGSTRLFSEAPRPGDRGQLDPGGNGRSDLMLPMPGVVRN
jgi:hypothetical protein